MNKRILALIVVFVVILIVLLIVLANRRTGGGGTTPTPSPGSEQITLTWWNLFEPEANVKPLIDKFKEENPNVNIQYVQVGKDSVDSYRMEIESNLEDNDIVTSPDIFPVHNTWAGRFQELSVPAPTSVISNEDLQDFHNVIKADFVKKDRTYALPLYLDTVAIIYNKSLLQSRGYTEPAVSWSDFELQARELTVRNNSTKITRAGFSAYLSSNSEFYFEMFNNLLLQNEVDVVNSEGRSTLASQPEAEQALRAYAKFVEDNTYKSWDASLNRDIAMFLEGNLAMYPATAWRLNDLLSFNQKYGLGLNIGVAQVPQFYQADEHYFPSYWGMAVSKDSQHSELAWKFIEFITENEQLQLLNDTVIANGRPKGILYPRLSMAESNRQDPLLAPYAISLTKARTWDMYDGWALKKRFDQIFTGRVDINAVESAINAVLKEN